MKKNIMFLALAAIGFAGCNGGFKQDPSGLLYDIHSEKSSTKIKQGDFVSAYLVIKNDADSVIYNAYDGGQPQYLVAEAAQFKGDMMDGLKLVGEGDSVTFKIVADSLFKGGQPRPDKFKSSKYVVYDLKIEKVIPKGKLTDEVFQRTISTYIKGQVDAVKKQEPAKIQKYIADNKLNVAKTDSGLYYVINKQGTGAVIAPGDTAVVNYTGKLLNGKVFDSNIKAEAVKGGLQQIEMRPFQPIRFPVGQQQVIAGWDQGLQLLNKGAKATFIIPSALGYGERGNQVIPGNAPLVFEVELIDIVHPKK
ncbi:FKBP-type peptidyl-prolyl cis-trans isomerase [Mucilaginibacter auburnensis]|uniref:Peptidyl-prolyl cis-trans isomerase n=1 Tax=Mucilaginibacter auburnensis TaxID=1457233 RepID=A0A2H9VQV3_9SPHI|nr:FKBP-type peptidyl-prolyl cis-trans isomerase [Mucilaginibacter auburnensis]PJJ83201.1 FKBP-type peptidyl-prolyl cis-trans isomerase [Mucilaginibacter auburnensis]